jgi:hypothetical protein
MKHTNCTTRVVRNLLTGSLLAAASLVFADPGAECRQEAQDYAIPPEQAAEYIDGCILSRGGIPETAAGGETIPVDETGSTPLADTEQMNDAGQTDEALPGGVDGAY